VTGLYAAVGAVAGVVARRPVRIEVGLLEAAVSMLVNQAGNALVGGIVPTFTGNDHPNIAPYGPVPCKDRALVLGAGNDAQFAQLCKAIGLDPPPSWATNRGRVADRAAVTNALAAVFGRRDAQDWVPVLADAGVPCAPVQDLGALPGDPQIAATGLLQSVEHPAGAVTVVGSPYRIDDERPRVRRAPPLLGQHTLEVLQALGLGPADIEEVTGADRG
jgi:crotonobetainyl-CoA:carnitine CoA-transferase CaiB-like acyl-CoA transferase